jgi:beta-glucosidase
MNGMDMEMGSRPPYTNNYLGNPFLAGLNSGKYPMSVLDDKVARHLYVMFKLNLIHDPAVAVATDTDTQTSVEHQQSIRKPRAKSPRNPSSCSKMKNLLPLDAAKIKSIAIIGVNAVTKFASGGGAANIKAPYEITALEGISNRVGGDVKITYAPGYAASVGTRRRESRRCGTPAPAVNTNLIADAVAAAKSADVVIFVGGLHTGGYDTEGSDREDLKLPGGQDELLNQIVAGKSENRRCFQWWRRGGNGFVARQNARVALRVVWRTRRRQRTRPRPVRRRESLGQAALHLSEKLWPIHSREFFSRSSAYPGTNGIVTYVEGLLVGYRWFDARKNRAAVSIRLRGFHTHSSSIQNLNLAKGDSSNNPVTV